MPDRENSESSKTATLIITSISQFLAPVMGSAVAIALPSLGTEFKMEAGPDGLGFQCVYASRSRAPDPYRQDG